mgnify:FL=1
MMNVLKKYSGILFFYLAVVGMVLLISYRFTYLENGSNNNITYAINEWLKLITLSFKFIYNNFQCYLYRIYVFLVL